MLRWIRASLLLAGLLTLTGCSDEPMITAKWVGPTDAPALAGLKVALYPVLEGSAAKSLTLDDIGDQRIAIDLVPADLTAADVDQVVDAMSARVAMQGSRLTVTFPPPDEKPAEPGSMMDMLYANPDRPQGEHSSELNWAGAELHVYVEERRNSGTFGPNSAAFCRLDIPLQSEMPSLHVNQQFVAASREGESAESQTAARQLIDTVNTFLARSKPKYEHHLAFDDAVLAGVDKDAFGIDEEAQLLFIEVGQLEGGINERPFGASGPARVDIGGVYHARCARMLEAGYPELAEKYALSKKLRDLQMVRRNPAWTAQ